MSDINYASVGCYGFKQEEHTAAISIHDMRFCNKEGYGHFGKMVAVVLDLELVPKILAALNNETPNGLASQ